MLVSPTVVVADMNDDELAYKQAVCGRIQRARLKAGFTQEQMAALLGVRSRTYQNYEYDRIPWEHLDAIAEACDVEKAYLVTGMTEDTMPLREKLDLIEAELLALRRLLEDRSDEHSNGRSDP